MVYWPILWVCACAHVQHRSVFSGKSPSLLFFLCLSLIHILHCDHCNIDDKILQLELLETLKNFLLDLVDNGLKIQYCATGSCNTISTWTSWSSDRGSNAVNLEIRGCWGGCCSCCGHTINWSSYSGASSCTSSRSLFGWRVGGEAHRPVTVIFTFIKFPGQCI